MRKTMDGNSTKSAETAGAEKASEGVPEVMSGRIGDKITYSRIPIRNKYPLPSQSDLPNVAIEKLEKHTRLLIGMIEKNMDAIRHQLDLMNGVDGVEKTHTETAEKDETPNR